MNKLISNLLRSLKYNLKLKNKLLISYAILIIIPLLSITYISTKNSENYMQNQMVHSADQVLRQTADLVNYKVNSIVNASDQVFLNNKINNTLKKNEYADISPDLISDYYNLRDLITNVFLNIDVQRITLYVKNTIFFSTEYAPSNINRKVQIANVNDIVKQSWYLKFPKVTPKIVWVTTEIQDNTNSHMKVISSMRLIRDVSNYKDNIGILKIDLAQNDIKSIIQKADITQKGITLLRNSKGEVICASNNERIQEYEINTKTIYSLLESRKWNSLMLNGNEVMANALPIENTDWSLVSVIPRDEILATGTNTRNQLLVTMLVIAVFSYMLALVIANSITKRLKILTNRMKYINHNTFTKIMGHSGSDEVCTLISGYNYMINKLDDYTKEQYKLGKEMKNAELKTLQSQINPHFLYNTLDLVNWIAQTKNVPEISKIVQELATYYKLSLNSGQDIVSLNDEFTHIQTYVTLQNYRYDNSINLTICAAEYAKNVLVPKLILQPIIENAIIHGIRVKPSRAGMISVNVSKKYHDIFITVQDDGIGMSKQKLGAVRNFKIEENGGGYGIKNINYRIKLKFGEKYGISIQSTENFGTTVIIRIPTKQNNIATKQFVLNKKSEYVSKKYCYKK